MRLTIMDMRGGRTLYLVRHGEAADDALTDTGREQCALLAERLRGIEFDAVHHSTSQRAAESARLLTKALPGEVPVYPTDLLCECVPSVPRALTESERTFFDGFSAETLTAGARQAAEVTDRFTAPAERDRRELLVTHGNLIRWLTCRTLGFADGWTRMTDYNAGLTVLMHRADGTARVITYNDAGQLPAALRGTEYPARLRT